VKHVFIEQFPAGYALNSWKYTDTPIDPNQDYYCKHF
jgi:hypothetical protein